MQSRSVTRMSLFDVLKTLNKQVSSSDRLTKQLPIVNKHTCSHNVLIEKTSMLCNITQTILTALGVSGYQAAAAFYIASGPSSPNIIFIKSMLSTISDETPIKIMVFHNSITVRVNNIMSFTSPSLDAARNYIYNELSGRDDTKLLIFAMFTKSYPTVQGTYQHPIPPSHYDRSNKWM